MMGFSPQAVVIPATEFVDGLLQEAIAHRAVRHRYLGALANGEAPDVGFALADFARQYPVYTPWFPRYLSVVAAKLPDADREPLMDNFREERGFVDARDNSGAPGGSGDPRAVASGGLMPCRQPSGERATDRTKERTCDRPRRWPRAAERYTKRSGESPPPAQQSTAGGA